MPQRCTLEATGHLPAETFAELTERFPARAVKLRLDLLVHQTKVLDLQRHERHEWAQFFDDLLLKWPALQQAVQIEDAVHVLPGCDRHAKYAAGAALATRLSRTLSEVS